MLLYQLQTRLPAGHTIRAFADDIGLVVPDRRAALPILASTFHQFATYSALHLNLGKTMLIPISPLVEKDTSILSQVRWSQVDVSCNKGRYLGIILGHGASPLDSLEDIIAKFHKRLNHWAKTPLPSSYKFRVYNMFLHPLFSYYAQFYVIPHDVIKIVHSGLRKLIGGPSHWLQPQAAQRLRRYFH